jgi:protein-S-isoprenylcysteine O-methyltransferase Ste14
LLGKVIGKLVTLISVVFAVAVMLGLFSHFNQIENQWLLTVPYLAYEGLVAGFGIFQSKGRAFASNLTEVIVALSGTWLYPLCVAWLGGNLSYNYLFFGVYAWLALSALFLGRNFSVLPEAREIVKSGPYRIVRHPFYLGYCALWLMWAIGVGTSLAFALMVVGILLNEWRARLEEHKISTVSPEYREYMTKTWRMIPGLGRLSK